MHRLRSRVLAHDGEAMGRQWRLISCGHIHRWAIPRQIRIVQEIPKTSVGKVNKKLIREQELGGGEH